MKVLVIQQRMGLGDAVLYLPYILAISKKFNSPVSLLTSKNSKADQLFSGEEKINEIIFLDRKKDKSGTHDGIKGFFNLAKQLKEKKFDRVFIFNGSLRYFLLAKAAGIKIISQYPLFRTRDNIINSAKVFTENEIGSIVLSEPNLKIKNSQYKFDKEFKHICLGISASGPTKRWGIENYINLCDELIKTKKCKFYIAGGKDDLDLINIFKKSKSGKNCISFENYSIKETLPIIKNCDLYIGNDTGWAHISCSLGVKSLTLFMDSPVMAYGKYSNRMKVIEPEGEKDSTTHDTLGKDKISFEKVLSNTLELLV